MTKVDEDTTGAPVLTAVYYTGEAIGAFWGPIDGGTSYDFFVLQNQEEYVSSVTADPHIEFVVGTGGLPQGYTYAVRVCTSGACSVDVPLIINPPQGLNATLTDAGINVQWEPVDGAAKYGLVFSRGSNVVQDIYGSAHSQLLPYPFPVTEPTSYTLSVYGLTGYAGDDDMSKGPGSSKRLTLYPPPVLEKVVWNGKEFLTASWTATPDIGTPVYTFEIIHLQKPYYSSVVDVTQKRFRVVLPPPRTYTVKVREKNTPWSAEEPVVFAVPGLTVGTDGVQIIARWEGGAYLYEAELACNGVWSGPQQTTSNSFVFPPHMQPNTEYKVRVRAFVGVSEGPWTNPPMPGPFLSVRSPISYDALGRVRQETFPSRGIVRYTYDNFGNITSVVAERAPPSDAPQPPG